jgi:hypothetical protein
MDVLGNFNGFFEVIGYQFGSIGTLNIGGALTGDANGDTFSGYIQFSGHIDSATIGNIVGSTANNTGELVGPADQGAGGIASLHVTGSITGGTGNQSGSVFVNAGNFGKVTVDGNLVGGGGQESGVISANEGSIRSVHIGGSIDGGSNTEAGLVSVTGNIGSMQVLGSINGGGGVDSGIVSVVGRIGKIDVAGSVIGGTAGTAADTSTNAAAVHGFTGLIESNSAGSIIIGGSLVGGTPVPLTVTTDGTQNATADTSGEILVNSVTSINIGGGITANGGPSSAVITGENGSTGVNFGSIIVGGDIVGGAGAMSGGIFAQTVKTLHVGGNLTGSSGSQTGQILTQLGMGTVYIGGDVTGGSGSATGEIYATTSVTNLHIGGNLVGGTADVSGVIFAGDALTTVTIGGNIDGNVPGTPISAAGGVMDTGYIEASTITSLNITGGINAGINSAGQIANSGGIRADVNIGSITIGGPVTGTAANPVIISAEQGPGNSAHLKSDLAIGSVTVHGAASYLDILAGYSPPTATTGTGPFLGGQSDGAAQIGTLDFLSTLSASNLVAGALPDSNGQFGDTGNTAFTPRPDAIGLLSGIAKITVAGAATGDMTPADSFGIVAEQLGAVTIKGTAVATDNLIPGVPVLVPASNNLFLLEPLVT